MIEGTLGASPISAGKLTGTDVTFTAGGRVYTGRIDGDTMTGIDWTARRSH